jgi:DNA-binding MarR family transcriptional regulator
MEDTMADAPLTLKDFACFAVHSAGHALNRAYKPLLDRLGLTYPQYLVMVALWEAEGVTLGALGERLFLDSSTLTPLLKRLEAQGLLHRQWDPADERQLRITLTERGRAMQAEAAAIPGCLKAASGMTAEELVTLREAANRLRDALLRAG